MSKQFTITKKWINDNMTARGGVTKKMLNSIGIDYSFTRGKGNWKDRLAGTKITLEQKANYEEAAKLGPLQKNKNVQKPKTKIKTAKGFVEVSDIVDIEQLDKFIKHYKEIKGSDPLRSQIETWRDQLGKMSMQQQYDQVLYAVSIGATYLYMPNRKLEEKASIQHKQEPTELLSLDLSDEAKAKLNIIMKAAGLFSLSEAIEKVIHEY